MHLLAITPGTGFEPKAWGRVLASGVDAFMIREKGMEARALLEATRWCQREAPGVALWVNGRWDVALAAGVGLHAPEAYPEASFPGVPLSRPLHGEAQAPARRQAQQWLVSPIFPSPGKGVNWGVPRLHAWLNAMAGAHPRLLALGGVVPANVRELRHPALAGIAAIRPFWEGEPGQAVVAFRRAWEGP